jgi:peptidoglycan biosynthesis protein MviN/MurJ (putative lipid II flippase)
VLVSLALNTGIDLILLPRIGVVGAAVGTGVALSLLYVPAHFRICRQELGLELAPIALTLLRSLVSAALMGSVLYAVGTRTLSAKQWLLGGVAGALAFCVGLAVTGELTPTEIRKVRQVVIAGLARVTFSFR